MMRRILLSVLALVAVLVVAVLGVLGVANTQWGRAQIAGLVEDATADGPVAVSIGAIDGRLPDRIVLRDVAAADSDGVFARVGLLVLDWRVLDLAGGRLGISAVELSQAELARLPVLPETPPEPEPVPPEPLSLRFAAPDIEISLDRLTVSTLTLGADVAGEPVTIRADLGAALTVGAASARGWIEAARSAGPPARAEIDAALVPESGVLRADLSLREPEGGLLADLLEIEGRPPLAVSLSGEGGLDNWRGALEGGFGANAGLDLDLVIASDVGGHRLSIDGGASLARLAPAELRSLLAERIALRVSAHARPDGSFRLDTLAASLPALSLKASAETDSTGRPVAAEADLTLPDLAAFQDLAGLTLAGDTTVRARLEDQGRQLTVSVTGRPVTDGIVLDDLALSLVAQADAALADLPPEIRVTLDTSLATPEIDGLDAPALLGPTAALSATGTVMPERLDTQIDTLTLTTDAARVEGRATLTGGTRLTPSLTLTVADMARLRDLAGMALSGRATVDVDGTVDLDPLSVTATLAVAGDGLGLGDPALDGIVGSAPTLLTGVTLDADQRLELLGLDLVTAAARVGGDLSLALASGDIGGRVDLVVEDLSAVAEAAGTDLAGRAAIAAVLGGTIDAPAAAASWRVERLRAEGTEIDEITGSVTAAGLPDAPTGTLESRVLVMGQPVDIALGYGLAGERLQIAGLTVDGLGATASGDLDLDLGTTLADGRLSLRVADLGILSSALDLPLTQGRVDGDIRLRSAGRQTADVALELTGLALEDGTSVERAALTAALAGLTGTPGGRADLSITGAATDGARLETATVGADIADGIARVSIEANAEAGAPAILSALASVPLDPSSAPIEVDRLEASYGDVTIRQMRLLRVALAPATRIEDIDLSVDDGRISGHVGLDPAAFDIRLAIRDLPASLARLADPSLALEGRAGGDITVTGPIEDPTVAATLSTPGIRTLDPDLAEVPPLVAAISLALADRRADAKVDASIGDGASATVRARVDGRAGPAGAPPVFDEGAPLDASVNADMNLARVSAFLPIDLLSIAGTGRARVTAGGTLGDPALAGTVTVRGGQVDVPSAGLYLRDLELEAEGAGQTLAIRRFETRAAGGGSLSASGDVSADPETGFPMDLTVTARNFNASDLDIASVSVDLDLALTGALPQYLLAGDITVLPTEIQIPDTLPPSVVEIDVVEIRDGKIVGAPETEEAAQEEANAPLRLDLAIDVPGQVFVRGRGLESEWGGQLKVTGLADAPVVDGEIAVRRGVFNAIGKTFDFERGAVLFDGGPAEDPALDMRLATDVTNIRAAIIVAGRASAPDISLESDPSLPEEDILSRLLFGSDKAELTPIQALKLAQSAAVLSGNFGSGPGITDQLRDTLGVDSLDVDADTNDDGSVGASLSVGKYIAPGVFLKLQQGLSADSSRAVVEVEVTDTISVETDVGADSQSRVGLNYELDY